MRARFLLFSILVLFALNSRVSSQEVVLDQHYLNVPYDQQQTIVWCWVAAARMVARYYRVDTPSQCDMLQQQYNAPCCMNYAACTRPGHITEIQALIARFGLRSTALGPPADGWSLLRIFKNGNPVVLWVDGSHFVVATGMRVIQTAWGPLGVVRIADPFYGVYDEPLPKLYTRWGAGLYVSN